MPLIERVPFCDGCGAEIHGPPEVRDDRMYCCQDCAAGLACDCALEFDEEYRGAHRGSFPEESYPSG